MTTESGNFRARDAVIQNAKYKEELKVFEGTEAGKRFNQMMKLGDVIREINMPEK